MRRCIVHSLVLGSKSRGSILDHASDLLQRSHLLDDDEGGATIAGLETVVSAMLHESGDEVRRDRKTIYKLKDSANSEVDPYSYARTGNERELGNQAYFERRNKGRSAATNCRSPAHVSPILSQGVRAVVLACPRLLRLVSVLKDVRCAL